MEKVKKAQMGALIKKGLKAGVKKITKFSSEAEKIAAGQKPNLQKAKEAAGSLDGTIGLGKKPYSKRGLEMAIERRTNPVVAKKKMTKAQRDAFALDESYRKNGGPVKKMQNGGSLSGLKASTKRVGPVDPNGAWTKVQERTIAGKKASKVPLKKDKQLDASRIERKQAGGGKMKMGGSVKKK
jgi:hypothetical protein